MAPRTMHHIYLPIDDAPVLLLLQRAFHAFIVEVSWKSQEDVIGGR
jgi:hypothetical protein